MNGLTNRNPKFESKNQGAPELGTADVMHGVDLESGDDNKGKEYRSKKGSKSRRLHNK